MSNLLAPLGNGELTTLAELADRAWDAFAAEYRQPVTAYRWREFADGTRVSPAHLLDQA